jgi:Na+-transporting methylmalonyl-CoA/oxaloacetate decarboxylase gamma subunit
MPLSESLLVALFTMAVVFTVLILLWVIIRLFSSMIRVIERDKGKKSSEVNY